jgi:oligopeptidase B
MNLTRITMMITFLSLVVACGTDKPEAPAAAKKPTELEMHGDVRIDEYYWLRERENPDVIRYLEKENAYTDSILGEHADFEKRLIEEMKSRMAQVDQSAPVPHGDYFYYRRYEEGKEHPIYCRRKGSMDAEEEVLLDMNIGAEGHAFYSVRGFKVSPDHTTFGYAVDTIGRRFYDIHFVDIETGEELNDTLEAVTPNFVWAADNKTVFFVKQDPQTLRWHRIYRHELGSNSDELVYEETDETYSTFVYQGMSGAYSCRVVIITNTASSTASTAST